MEAAQAAARINPEWRRRYMHLAMRRHKSIAKVAMALARLGLARAYAMRGDTVKTRPAYQDFLILWKDADPDIPLLIAAKAQYAKLH